MIGVAFLNELIFWAIGLVVGIFFGKKYMQIKHWGQKKGWIK